MLRDGCAQSCLIDLVNVEMIYPYVMKRMLFGALVLVAITASGYVRAIELDSAVAYALENNPGLRAVEQQVNASMANARVSRAGDLPSVTFSHTARFSDNPLDAFADKLNTRQVRTQDFDPAALNQPGWSDLYFTQVAMRWPVYTGGRQAAQVEDAEASELNRKLHYQREREYTAFETTRAYLIALAAKQGLSISEDAVAALQHHADTTAKLAREGRIVESDKLAAQVSLAAVKAQYEQAVTRYKSALNALKLVMGMSLDNELVLSAASIATADVSELSAYEKLSLDLRKDIAAVRAQLKAASARIDAARSSRMPNVDIVASTNWYDDKPGLKNNSSSIMGVLSMDLYNGQRDAKVDTAVAQQREVKWHLQALEQNVLKQVRDAYNSLQESISRLAIAENNVDTAKRTVVLVKQRYGQGRTILLDLLQAERLYTDARIEKMTAALNLDLARSALSLASGELSLPGREAP